MRVGLATVVGAELGFRHSTKEAPTLPKLVRTYIQQVAIGFLLSAVFVAGLLFFNVANLWHLVSGSSAGIIACIMLFVFNGIVFAGVQFGIVIMRMADKEDGGDGGRRQKEPVLNPALVPVPVSDEARPRG